MVLVYLKRITVYNPHLPYESKIPNAMKNHYENGNSPT